MTSAINAQQAYFATSLQSSQGRRLVASTVGSASRLVKEKNEIASAASSSEVREHIERVVCPKSLSGTMRKVGIALVAAPEPLSGVPGAALLVSSYIAKRKEPVGLSHLAQETRKLVRDLQSLRI